MQKQRRDSFARLGGGVLREIFHMDICQCNLRVSQIINAFYHEKLNNKIELVDITGLDQSAESVGENSGCIKNVPLPSVQQHQSCTRHKYRNMVVCPTCSINRRTQNTNRSSTVTKTKTNHVVVLETLSATFHFLRTFSILVSIVLKPCNFMAMHGRPWSIQEETFLLSILQSIYYS